MRKNILLFFLLLPFLGVQSQICFYVSPDGSDQNTGISPQSPFKSFECAYQQALSCQNADSVYIQMMPGTYYLDKTIQISRSPASATIVIQGDIKGGTIISGGMEIRSWEAVGNGLWKSHVNETERYNFRFEQLYINETRATRAKSPDKGYYFVNHSDETVHYKGTDRIPQYTTLRLDVTPTDITDFQYLSDEEKNDVVATFFHKWDNTRRYLSQVCPDSGYIYLNGKGAKPWNPITKGSRFFLENYKKALSEEGEWYLSKDGDLYYIHHQDEQLQNTIGYVPVLETLIQIQGEKGSPVKNLVFRNLIFKHTGYIMPKTGNDAEQAAASISATIQLDYANNIHFSNCIVAHTGNYGFWFNKSCENSSVNHTLLMDLGAGGIKIGENKRPLSAQETNHITVENNIIQQTGRIFPCAVGVAIFHASHNKVIHNEISDLLYTGISIGWTWGYGTSPSNHNEIAYNHIHHIGWGILSDMGGIYTLGNSPGTHIHHNVIHDVYSYDYGGWGIYTDEGSSQILIENNLVYACKSGGFHQHYGTDNIIRNNIFAFGLLQQLQLTRAEKHKSFDFTNNIVLFDQGMLFKGAWKKANMNMENNLYWYLGDEQSQIKKTVFEEWKDQCGKHAIWLNPLFKNPVHGDFTFSKQTNIKKIGFKPFDFRQAGVYGTREWKEKARMSGQSMMKFVQMVRAKEKQYSVYYR